MALTSALPYVDSSLGTSGGLGGPRWPVVAGSVSWAPGRRIPTLRCALVASDHQQGLRLAALAPAAASAGACSSAGRRLKQWPSWAGSPSSLVARTRQLASALADTHKAWSSQSLQTLQRVGSMIRSTSLECIAALGTSAAAAATDRSSSDAPAAAPHALALEQQPSGGVPGPSGNDSEDDEADLVRASLRRFLTTASQAEVAQAAMLSDLSNMAYDVHDVTPERLQREWPALTLVAHSRTGTEPAAGGSGRASPAQLQRPQQEQASQQGPWPAPMSLMQPAGSLPLSARSSSGSFSGSLPTSPRSPMVLSSFSDSDDHYLAEGLHQMVTASGTVADAAAPRRRSSAAAASAGAAVRGAPCSPSSSGSLPVMASSDTQPYVLRPQRSSSGGELVALDLQAFSSDPMHFATQQQEQAQQANSSEQALLAQMKQQEALLLLEMQANRQLLRMLQQQQEEVAAGEQQQQEAPQRSLSAMAVAAAATMGGSALPYPEPLMGVMADAVHAATAADALSDLQEGAAGSGAPADWFCCDGPASSTDPTPTRIIVIQGSITLQHWRINLTIDPAEFEGGALGAIKVHRGVYEAALEMYGLLLPLVQQHLEAHPGGRVAFTGHSLGGSLATLLMLLYVHRGVLPVPNVATVRTFGSPAIFCEGASASTPGAGACQSCSLPCQHRAARVAASSSSGGGNGGSASGGLLARLGLAEDSVVNVVMTRDIVPRAFVCDYTAVAGVLRSWLPFKEHTGLAACKSHKALYNFVGAVEVLQPKRECDFVLADEGHSMLPPDAALYRLTEPPARASSGAGRRGGARRSGSRSGGRASGAASPSSSLLSGFTSLSALTSSLSSASLSTAFAELTSGFTLGGASGRGAGSSNGARGMVAVPVSAAEAAADQAAAASAASVSSSAAAPAAPLASVDDDGLTLGDAILTFMNSPHPLQTLKEVRAYGPNGSISRYHNPNSYTKALLALTPPGGGGGDGSVAGASS